MKPVSSRNAVALAIAMAAAYGTQAHAATAAGTTITNQASATYVDSTSTARSATSNTVITTVQQVAAISLSAAAAKNAAPGAQVVYATSITNNGNGADIFALSTSNSGAYSMTGVVFYADANGDGIADNATPVTTTGSLAPGAVFRVVAVATLPANATNGSTNNLVVTATSGFNGAVTASVTDTTTVLTGAAIDITANSSGPGAPGAGPGVEASAVATNTTTAGTTTRFTMYLNNTGGSADTFTLAGSSDPTFGATTLPSGWTVVFRDSNGQIITSATANAGTAALVYADVTVAPGAPDGTTDVYFRALSPTSGVNDRIHDAVTVVTAGPQITLTKTQALDANCDGIADTPFSNANITTGAVPGACIRYEITATNVGITNVTAVVISDNIPVNTVYHATVVATTTQGAVVTPLANSAGTVVDAVGVLNPSQSAKLSFGVRITP
ncbi:MAG: hypothetical protein M3Y65_22950 [Pseudomonadota bacterium]|nr:hypothetical protein [Pseudomonadota bacterium]